MLGKFVRFARRRIAAARSSHQVGASAARDARQRLHDLATQDVEAYYDSYTGAYRSGFGTIFQGSRPDSTEFLVDYLIEAAQLADGQRVLDAGCGIGGPAVAFASRLDLDITGITLSQVQVEEARRLALGSMLRGRAEFAKADFHRLAEFAAEFAAGQPFDRVLFLESLCHAVDYRQALQGARSVLKPGGRIYIKDFYAVDYRAQPERIEGQAADLRKLSSIYNLRVPDLVSVLDLVSELGFQLIYLRMPQFEPTYTHWAAYEGVTGRPWAPTSGQPGEVIQGFELMAQV